MISKELINRINELARKKKTEGLTEVEQTEQQELYTRYLKAIRKQVKEALDSIAIVDGNIVDSDTASSPPHQQEEEGSNKYLH